MLGTTTTRPVLRRTRRSLRPGESGLGHRVSSISAVWLVFADTLASTTKHYSALPWDDVLQTRVKPVLDRT